MFELIHYECRESTADKIFFCLFSILCCEINIMYLRTKEKALGTNAAGQCLTLNWKVRIIALATIMIGGGGVQDS